MSPNADMLLTEFADKADGEWPPSERTQALWEQLVAGCLAEQVALDRAELRQWVTDNGWNDETAGALTDRFFADSARLAKWLAVVAP